VIPSPTCHEAPSDPSFFFSLKRIATMHGHTPPPPGPLTLPTQEPIGRRAGAAYGASRKVYATYFSPGITCAAPPCARHKPRCAALHRVRRSHTAPSSALRRTWRATPFAPRAIGEEVPAAGYFGNLAAAETLLPRGASSPPPPACRGLLDQSTMMLDGEVYLDQVVSSSYHANNRGNDKDNTNSFSPVSNIYLCQRGLG
jgi:hypothetical protein